MDRTLSGATTLDQSGPRCDGNEGVLCIPQSSSITEASPSDCLVSYPGLLLGESYSSAEKQSVYSTASANWTNIEKMQFIYFVIYKSKIYIYIYIYNQLIGIMIKVFINGLGDWVQSQVKSYQGLKQMVLDASLFNTQHYKVWIKWSNPGKSVVSSPLGRLIFSPPSDLLFCKGWFRIFFLICHIYWHCRATKSALEIKYVAKLLARFNTTH